jgi:hypothetical protein
MASDGEGEQCRQDCLGCDRSQRRPPDRRRAASFRWPRGTGGQHPNTTRLDGVTRSCVCNRSCKRMVCMISQPFGEARATAPMGAH